MAESVEKNRQDRLAELAAPVDPIRDAQQEEAERIAQAQAENDPLAEQVARNQLNDHERHPASPPRTETIDLGEAELDRAEEIRTGRTVIRQRGHLGRAQ